MASELNDDDLVDYEEVLPTPTKPPPPTLQPPLRRTLLLCLLALLTG